VAAACKRLKIAKTHLNLATSNDGEGFQGRPVDTTVAKPEVLVSSIYTQGNLSSRPAQSTPPFIWNRFDNAARGMLLFIAGWSIVARPGDLAALVENRGQRSHVQESLEIYAVDLECHT
jgi:hypothetical protein